MHRLKNVYYNLVTDENSTTELLCNLLQFERFRAHFLQLMFPDIDTSDLSSDHIDTQIDLGEFGIPDIHIRNSHTVALIEAKVTPSLRPTDNQPRGYMRYLERQTEPCRRFAFLVPANWRYKGDVKEELQQLDSHHTGAIGGVLTNVITWDQVVNMIRDNGLNNESPFIEEFEDLLIARFGLKPIHLTSQEVSMLFSDEIPTALTRLQQIIDGLQQRSTFKVRLEGSRSLCPTEYGLYFQAPNGKNAFWFGLWTELWLRNGWPLCFGVDQKWGPQIKQAFLNIYKDQTRSVEHGYTVGWIKPELFESDYAIDEIWALLGPIVEATVAAASLK